MSRVLLLLVALGLAWGGPVFAQGRREDGDTKGGHPLAERSGSLEDLLFEKDWPVDGQPQVALPESPPQSQSGDGLNRPDEAGSQNPPAADVGTQLQDLIRERNGIVDGGQNLLAVLQKLNTEEQKMAMLVRQRSQAQGNLSAATLALNQALAMGGAAPPGAAENAQNRVKNATLHLRELIEQCTRQSQKMQPLYARVNPAIGPWFACYGKMRALFSHDRQDPNRGVVLPILEAECMRRGDFCEGRVLAAIGCVYDGRPDAARDHLKAACQAFGPCDLFKSVFANDCCHGYLLLGLPDETQAWTKWVDEVDAKRQTAARCWLVGQAAMLQCKDNNASVWFGRSLSKSRMLAKEKPAPASPVLVGDAAFFYLTCANQKVRNPAKARDLIAKVPTDGTCWQMLRARAALAADAGEWKPAVELIKTCGNHCPPTMQEEVADQQKSYEAEQSWLRTRPK